jgi:hypothetical protein
VRISGEEILRLAVKVREIAASSSRYKYFLSDTLGVIKQSDTAAAFTRFNGAHKPRCAGSQDYYVEFVLQRAP